MSNLSSFFGLLLCYSYVNGRYNPNAVLPNGKVWDRDDVTGDWKLLDQSLISMDIPYFEVLNPKDTDLWQCGDWVTIQWNSYHHQYDTVSISLWTKDGEKVRNIVLSTDDNGSANW
eukprot:CAMPEP_0114691810 /NCGR_PEP_ID=MMETSP0191-20121206/67240_1 /TAXON_ID=126664 /ORGANISM="Sorites sp." /LENGTH=115 /DNA_ID=CAMNT_0001983445 /DNA_START=373 /DNA_END=717 /DNA_ORIENTATION=+